MIDKIAPSGLHSNIGDKVEPAPVADKPLHGEVRLSDGRIWDATLAYGGAWDAPDRVALRHGQEQVAAWLQVAADVRQGAVRLSTALGKGWLVQPNNARRIVRVVSPTGAWCLFSPEAAMIAAECKTDDGIRLLGALLEATGLPAEQFTIISSKTGEHTEYNLEIVK